MRGPPIAKETHEKWTLERIAKLEKDAAELRAKLQPPKHPNPDFQIEADKELLDSLQDKMAAIRELCTINLADGYEPTDWYSALQEILEFTKDDK